MPKQSQEGIPNKQQQHQAASECWELIFHGGRSCLPSTYCNCSRYQTHTKSKCNIHNQIRFPNLVSVLRCFNSVGINISTKGSAVFLFCNWTINTNTKHMYKYKHKIRTNKLFLLKIPIQCEKVNSLSKHFNDDLLNGAWLSCWSWARLSWWGSPISSLHYYVLLDYQN